MKKEELESRLAARIAELQAERPERPTTPGRPINAPAFRRREGRTIKLETAPTTPTPGVVFLIKGGQR